MHSVYKLNLMVILFFLTRDNLVSTGMGLNISNCDDHQQVDVPDISAPLLPSALVRGK